MANGVLVRRSGESVGPASRAGRHWGECPLWTGVLTGTVTLGSRDLRRQLFNLVPSGRLGWSRVGLCPVDWRAGETFFVTQMPQYLQNLAARGKHPATRSLVRIHGLHELDLVRRVVAFARCGIDLAAACHGAALRCSSVGVHRFAQGTPIRGVTPFAGSSPVHRHVQSRLLCRFPCLSHRELPWRPLDRRLVDRPDRHAAVALHC